MVDLSQNTIQKYWAEHPDPSILRVITFMESVETWTKDGDAEIEDAILKLGTVLDTLLAIEPSEFGQEALLMELLASLKMSRALYILHILDQKHPGAVAKLLLFAEQNSQSKEDAAGLFLRRNIVFERMRLIGRIFSEERLALISESLEKTTTSKGIL